MLITELVDSEAELLNTVISILLRAKAEGAKKVDMQQLINDLHDDSLTPELMVDIFNRHTGKLKNIIAGSTVDEVDLDIMGKKKQMTTKADQDTAKIKNTAAQQALDNLKGSLL